MGLFLHEFDGQPRQPTGRVLGRVEVGVEFVVTGAVFLLIGTILAFWAAWHYQRTRRLIIQGQFEPATRSPLAVAALVFSAGVLIIAMILARGLPLTPLPSPPAAASD